MTRESGKHHEIKESARTDLTTGGRRPPTGNGYALVNTRRGRPERTPTVEITPAEIAAATNVVSVPKPYPDPTLCRCAEMVEATARPKLIDVVFKGPVFLVPLVTHETGALRDDSSFIIAEAAMRHLIRLRYCPFDGTLLDPEVEIKPLAAYDPGEPPCCCGTMDDLVRAERVRLPSLQTSRDFSACCERSGGRPKFFQYCPFCAASMLDLAIARRGHDLATHDVGGLDLAPAI